MEREGGLYHFWRLRAISLLGEWERSEATPALRHALDKSWKFEQADQVDRKQIWHAYQDELVYALGRLGEFGGLTGFSLPASRLQLWRILLTCGAIQARKRYGDFLTQMQINQTLKEEIAREIKPIGMGRSTDQL